MEGFVCVEKQERLIPYTFGNTNLKELVLTDADPFPGYYSEVPVEPDTSKPKFVFVALKPGKGFYEDQILRASFILKQKLNYFFELNYGRILLFNKMKPCIRIHIENYEYVPEIIEEIKKLGIGLEPAQKVTPYESNIKVRKYLSFTEIEKDIYKCEAPNNYYIRIPKHLKWKDFVDLIFSIRRSGDFGVFDAAQTSLYQKDNILEFVRIYAKSFETKDLIVLQQELLKRI